jgi:hypothetical protein
MACQDLKEYLENQAIPDHLAEKAHLDSLADQVIKELLA